MKSLISRWSLAALGLFIAEFIFLVSYLEHEHTIPFWDYAMYANMALQWFDLPHGTASFRAFAQSFSQNYNLLFALPASVAFSWFSPSRTVFILTNFVVYFGAYQIGVAFVLRQIFALHWPPALCFAALVVIAVPFAWYPLFQGYPDHAAAALLTFAVGLAVTDKAKTALYLEIGLLLGFSILLRRHYAYPALAVIGTMGLFDLYEGSRQRLIGSGRWIFEKGLTYAVLGVGLLAVLFLCEPSYLREIIQTDYLSLYKSYERTPCYFVYFAFSHVGLGLLCLSLIGYGAGSYLYPSARKGIAFVAALMLIWLVLWLAGPRQAGDHYLLAVLPLFCLVGLYSFIEALANQKKLWPVLGAIIFLLAGNTVHAFWGGSFELPSQTPSLGFFGSARPPWVRDDVKELESLAAYVKDTTTDQDKIVVVGSSFLFNQDLLRTIYVDTFNDISTLAHFLQAPETDGQQDPPLDVYAAGTVFLVATPTQYHLPEDGQRVVTSLAAQFPPSPEILSAFTKDKRSFTLDNGALVEIWRRTNAWTPATLKQSLSKIRNIIDTPRRWVAYQADGLFQFSKTPDDHKDIVIIQHPQGEKKSALFYDHPLTTGGYRLVVQDRFAPGCEDIQLTGQVLNGAGRILSQESVPVYNDAGYVYLPFTVPKAKADSLLFLSLTIRTKASPAGCTVALKQLHLEQTDIQGLP